MTTPRGIRNNNPLNIRKSKDKWKGQQKWAPPHENNTASYIANVSKLTGIGPDEPIGIPSDQPARWMMLGAAMAIQENGTNSIDYFAMLRGWELCRNDCR